MINKKPTTVSVKSFLIRRIAVDLMIPQNKVEAVIDHQFRMALEALKCKESVEISGFGKFILNQKRVVWRWDKCMIQKKVMEDTINDPLTSDVKRRNSQLKLNTVLENIEALKILLHEYS